MGRRHYPGRTAIAHAPAALNCGLFRGTEREALIFS
jgi:hypothetical protein